MNKRGLTTAALQVIAMVLMLCDHIAGTLLPNWWWLHCVGRLAFPIFAFLLAEGYGHTSNYRRYCLRLFVFALLTEVPFDLMVSYTWFDPFYQNVLWTFLISLWTLRLLDRARCKTRRWAKLLLGILAVLFGYVMGYIFCVDYFGEGVLMVVAFYLLRGQRWWHRLGQLAALWLINESLGGYGWEVVLLGHTNFIPMQLLAVLSLPLIWCYRGVQGHHSKAFRWCRYAYYPVHMAAIWLLMNLIYA